MRDNQKRKNCRKTYCQRIERKYIKLCEREFQQQRVKFKELIGKESQRVCLERDWWRETRQRLREIVRECERLKKKGEERAPFRRATGPPAASEQQAAHRHFNERSLPLSMNRNPQARPFPVAARCRKQAEPAR
jgi:hypothetical protein